MESKKNFHVHLLITTETSNRLKIEAKDLGICVNEIIRRKLSSPPTPEEVLLFRQLKKVILKNE